MTRTNIHARPTFWAVRLPLLILFLLGLVATAQAQIGTATVKGTVTDEQGAAIAGATVTLTSTQTNVTRKQSTNASGGYAFTGITPGDYTLDVEAAGFKKSVVDAVKALVDTNSQIDVRLAVGQTSEIITVSSDTIAAIVNKQDASLGNTIVQKQIIELPLAARNIAGLLSLQPGVAPDGSVTGSRSDQANTTLDGVDVNEQQNNAAFAPVLRTSPESVEEFRVTVSNPNANQGRSAGAQVSLVTKSGTNEFHGSAFEFHRNTVGQANNWFNNAAGLPNPRLLQNIFGGAIGGPILKNRLFFFYNYEGRRDRSEASVLSRVPLPNLGRGELRVNAVNTASGASAGIVTLTQAQFNQAFAALATAGGGSAINPAATAYLADAARRYPANDTGIGDGINTGGYRFNAGTPFNFNSHIARLDWNADAEGKHILFARANVQYDTIQLAPAFPDTRSPGTWQHPDGIAAGHTWTINSKLVNNFRYGLTRNAFSNQGDTPFNLVVFRFAFTPTTQARDLSRTVPVHNFTDDLTYTLGNHTLQFGSNIRVIRNRRSGTALSFDFGVVNPTFYSASLTTPVNTVLGRQGQAIAPGGLVPVRDAANALIGRVNQFTANFQFDRDGSLLPSGTPVDRNFAAEEYDFYVQDVWRLRQNLTLTYGLRYGLSRPVYEQNGFQTGTNIALGDYFDRRRQSALEGRPFNDPITIQLAGPANDGESLYQFTKNNFQPRAAISWTPNFKDGLLGKILGKNQESVLRAGFALVNDYFGQQLAVQFDLQNTLGFVQAQNSSFAQFNLSTRPAPLFTGQGQSFRGFPGIDPPARIRFPLTQPSDGQTRIEQSLDQSVRLPRNYTWNVSFGRQLPADTFVEVAYIGRLSRNLLAQRDVMALNNLRDPRSGVDWYTAAGQLEDLRRSGASTSQVAAIPYFENIFNPGLVRVFNEALGLRLPTNLTNTQAIYALTQGANPSAVGMLGPADWTTIQLILNGDDFNYGLSGISPLAERFLFFQPQYGALNTISSIGNSDYHGMTVSVRQRFKNQLTWDFNYTMSKSLDDASGLQQAGFFGATPVNGVPGNGFILNPLRQRDSRSFSDFDLRHVINANFVWQIPVGRGRTFLGSTSKVVDTLVGGWQLAGIVRWNSGLPAGAVGQDGTAYATNWQVPSNLTRIREVSARPTRGNNPNLFADPVAASQSFRSARPGETGERNAFRYPGFANLDMSLAKAFAMPWSEKQSLQFRWEVFNATNFQPFTTVSTLLAPTDPFRNAPNPNFGRLTAVQNPPRFMQFVLRYVF